MSFADNLRAVRKEKNISQEDLAALLNVSRQAVSKWEQGIGYPEMEKMIVLVKELDISLDYLVSGEGKGEGLSSQKQAVNATGRIMIRSQDNKAIVSCYKVFSYPVFIFKAHEGVPQYALFGVDEVCFLGENRTLLGWYADKESVEKELTAVTEALKNGEAAYELKFAAKVTKVKKKGFLGVELDLG